MKFRMVKSKDKQKCVIDYISLVTKYLPISLKSVQPEQKQ